MDYFNFNGLQVPRNALLMGKAVPVTQVLNANANLSIGA